MANVSEALESEVAAIRALRTAAANDHRDRAAADRHFSRIMRLIAPRIRHFTRAYGLFDVAEDAAQACAIGIHRAIEAYDPERARFTTFVNWQMRGELQSLRFRLRDDARDPARKVGARTVSLEALAGDAATAFLLQDDLAVEQTEALAAETMARHACGRLLDCHAQIQRGLSRRVSRRGASAAGRIDARIERDHRIVAAYLLGDEDAPLPRGVNSEQRRQIARRTVLALAEIARGNARFDPEARVS